MLKHRVGWIIPSSSLMLPPLLALSTNYTNPSPKLLSIISIDRANNLRLRNDERVGNGYCWARRRVRYEDEEEEEEEEEEGDYGYNEEIALLESYSQSFPREAFLVHAVVDEEQVEVLIFKGFSSSLSHETSPDPSRSVIPTRAVIKSIDIIRGPFDPSNIEYLETGLEWDTFKTRLPSTTKK